MEQKLDSHHRKQLRRLLDIHYPEFIKNDELYRRTGTERISLKILYSRITTLKNIIEIGKRYSDPARMDPANKYMTIALLMNRMYVGDRCRTSIIDCLKEDFSLAPGLGIKFDGPDDLTELAKWDEKKWREAIHLIVTEKRRLNHDEDEKKSELKKRKAEEKLINTMEKRLRLQMEEAHQTDHIMDKTTDGEELMEIEEQYRSTSNNGNGN